MVGTLDVQIPVVLWFKRQAIRNFPDNTKVATYYNDRLNKTITIPFSSVGVSESTNTVGHHSAEALEKLASRLNSKIKDAIKQFEDKIHKEVEDMRAFKSHRNIKEEMDPDDVSAYKQRRAWRKIARKEKEAEEDRKSKTKEKEPVNELSTDTIRSYMKKASKDHTKRRYDAGYLWDAGKHKEALQTDRKANLRHKYGLKAYKKLQQPNDLVKVVEADDKSELKQVRKWIKGTRASMGAQEYSKGGASDRFRAHLENLNKDKKDLKRSIKAKFAERNAERTAPKSKKQLKLNLESNQINELSSSKLKKYMAKSMRQLDAQDAKDEFDQGGGPLPGKKFEKRKNGFNTAMKVLHARKKAGKL